MTGTRTVTRTGRRMDRSLRGEIRSRVRNLPGTSWGVGWQLQAQPGKPTGGYVATLQHAEGETEGARVASLVPDLNTARFIAACREDVPDLLNECDRLEAENYALTIRLAQVEAILLDGGDKEGVRAGLWQAVNVTRDHAERTLACGLSFKEHLYDRLRSLEEQLTKMATAAE
jgi:hypothetical protein